MPSTYKEASFPVDYRAQEVSRIMDGIRKLRSVAITGLAGMGKSNVVRFIVSHPQVRARYLKVRADDTMFVHVDCAGLAAPSEAEILTEIGIQLHQEGISTGGLDWQGAQAIRRLLRDHILSIDPDLNLVIALDYFDEAAATLDKGFFNYLFHLRNVRPRGNLVYVFATRRPMGHLGELHELLDDRVSVGPLSRRDALDSIRRDERRLGHTFDAAEREALIACTGGHPGLLKNGCELLSSGRADASLPLETLAGQLLQSEKVGNLCLELWLDLTEAEQDILLHLAQGDGLSQSAGETEMATLETSGILVRTESQADPGMRIFCPLFETYARQNLSAVAGTIRIIAELPNRARIETRTTSESVTLSPKLFALLLALSKAQGQVLSTDEIISRVYGSEAAGVTNAALSQLVKRLRGMLDPHVRRMMDDPTYTAVETVRNTGYRLNG
jgi:DNA-binding winged helix-turn-helix (wHTH) protein